MKKDSRLLFLKILNPIHGYFISSFIRETWVQDDEIFLQTFESAVCPKMRAPLKGFQRIAHREYTGAVGA